LAEIQLPKKQLINLFQVMPKHRHW